MADLFDRFSGTAGALASHAPDAPASGAAWNDPSSAFSINGTGSLYCTATPTDGNMPSNANNAIPANCMAEWTIGADGTNTSSFVGASLRVTGSAGSLSYYRCGAYYNGTNWQPGIWRCNAGSLTGLVTTGSNLTLNTNDTFSMTVTGTTAPVVITFYQKGTVIGSYSDSSGSALTAAGLAGVVIGAVAGHTDMMRTYWAGGTAGPGSLTIAPTAPAIGYSQTWLFTASTGLTNETFSASATHGTTASTPTPTAFNYTAPSSSATTDTVTITSTDLPLRTVSAAPTLGTPTLSLGPTVAPPSATTEVYFYSTFTHWTGTAPTFTPSVVAGISPGLVTVISDTSAKAAVAYGASAGTATWTDSTTSATTTQVVTPCSQVLSVAGGLASGSATVGYAVYNADGTSFAPFTVGGVAEKGSGSGNYGALAPVPLAGQAEVRWSDGNTAPFASDVVADAPQSGDAYARIGAAGAGLTAVQANTVQFAGKAVVLDANNYPGVNLVDVAGSPVSLTSVPAFDITGVIAASPAPTATQFNVTLDVALDSGATSADMTGVTARITSGPRQIRRGTTITGTTVNSTTSLTLVFTAGTFSAAPSAGNKVMLSM